MCSKHKFKNWTNDALFEGFPFWTNTDSQHLLRAPCLISNAASIYLSFFEEDTEADAECTEPFSSRHIHYYSKDLDISTSNMKG